MPRQISKQNKANELCRLCSPEANYHSLCAEHSCKLNEKLSSLLDLCGGEFGDMIEMMLSVGMKENYCEISDLCVLIKKINHQWKIGSKSVSTFNTTQALKQFCRQKYQENHDEMTRKPPKNSASKNEFVIWAEENRIDLSSFRTRKYKKKGGKKKIYEVDDEDMIELTKREEYRPEDYRQEDNRGRHAQEEIKIDLKLVQPKEEEKYGYEFRQPHGFMDTKIPLVLPMFKKDNMFHSSIRVVNNSEPPHRLPNNIFKVLPEAFVAAMDNDLQRAHSPPTRYDIRNILN